jgi:hypothetical protein
VQNLIISTYLGYSDGNPGDVIKFGLLLASSFVALAPHAVAIKRMLKHI